MTHRMFVCATSLLVFLSVFVPPQDDPDSRVKDVKETIDRAGWLFADKKFSQSGTELRKAQSAFEKLVADDGVEIDEAIKEQYERLKLAHGLLIKQGVRLSELKALPEKETATKKSKNPFAVTGPMTTVRSKGSGATSKDLTDSKKETKTAKDHSVEPPPTQAAENPGNSRPQVSFVKDVAPILVQRCGTCHVRGTRGEFSAASFKNLMDGSPSGDVIEAKNPDDSLLVQLIEDGEMPPRGNLPANELQKIKEWIAEGAEFDGEDESANLTSYVPAGSSRGRGGRRGR